MLIMKGTRRKRWPNTKAPSTRHHIGSPMCPAKIPTLNIRYATREALRTLDRREVTCITHVTDMETKEGVKRCINNEG